MAVVSRDRLRALGRALKVEPAPGKLLTVEEFQGKWWLCGGREGGCALPRSGGCRTAAAAVEAAEGWLAPELDSGESAEARDQATTEAAGRILAALETKP